MHSDTQIKMRSRRRILAVTGVSLAAPFILKRSALAAGEVIIRTPGGSYEDVMRRVVYEPFTKQTGIKVTPVAATVAKLLAMFKANNVELDVIDTGDGPLSLLGEMGALAPIDYASWKWTKPEDILSDYKTATHVGNSVYASVLAYSKKSFPGDAHPKSWADFWDTKRFPGARTLADMASGYPSLEFALLADGVPQNALYPLDADRAFKSLTRIRGSVRKFWDTGAASAQLLSDNEVVLGHIWSTRVQTLIDQGAPLGVEWNENMIQVQALSIFRQSPNVVGAQRFIDFMLQPEVQASYTKALSSGPTNQKAIDTLTPNQIASLPGGPRTRQLGFLQNVVWWEANRERINRQWSKWILG